MRKLKKELNVFDKFSWIPYKNPYNHAREILKARAKNPHLLDSLSFLDNTLSKPAKSFSSKHVGDVVENLWFREIKRCGSSRRKPNLFWVLINSMVSHLAKIVFLNFCIRLMCVIGMLELINSVLETIDKIDQLRTIVAKLNTTMESGNQTSHLKVVNLELENTHFDLIIKLMSLIVPIGCQTLMFGEIKFQRCSSGIFSRIGLTQLIQRKSMRLNLATSIKESSSTAINLIANEVTIAEEAQTYFSYVIFGPFTLIVGSIWIAIRQTGWIPVLASYSIIVVIVGLFIQQVKNYRGYIVKRKEETKHRVEITNNFLNSIKVAKMYSWEKVFRKMIEKAREKELYWLEKVDRSRVIDSALSAIITKMLPTIVFMTYIWINGNISASILFTVSMGFYNFSNDGILMTVKGAKATIDLITSCKKIENYLLLPETVETHDKTRKKKEQLMITNYPNSHSKITCRNVSITFKEEPHNISRDFFDVDKIRSDGEIIKGLDVRIKHDELVMIVGQVGSGKSSLLLAILGEYKPTSGSLIVDEFSKISYASQEALIMADTIKNNILLGREFNPCRYKEVISACSLEPDLKMLPNGDETWVGSRGVSLSGGQKARVNLARAVYANSDIYLLDDPLSAVDARVAQHIFNNCLKQLLKNKLIILATHQRQFLNQASQIILLERGSKPIVGKPDELHEKCQFILTKEPTNIDRNVTKTNSKSLANDLSEELIIDQQAQLLSSRLKAANFSNGKKLISPYSLLIKLGFSLISGSILLITLFTLTPSNAFTDYYLRLWRTRIVSDSNDETVDDETFVQHLYIGGLLFGGLALMNAVLLAAYQLQLVEGLRRASQGLHAKLMNSLFSAKMSFYDFCPSGTLGTRYTSDFTHIDHVLPQIVMLVIVCTSWMVGFCIMISFIQPIGAALFVVLFVICAPSAVRGYKKSRSLIELSRMLRGPLYTNLSLITSELDTIRSDEEYAEYARDRFTQSQDRLTSMSMLTILYEARLSTLTRLPQLIVVAVNFYLILMNGIESLNVPTTGTLIMLVANIVSVFPFIMEMLGSVESAIVSVDSVQQLLNLAPEETESTEFDTKKHVWKSGRIEFNKVSLRYFEDEKPILQELSFVIEGGQRIGVVGRTGAGKSSIVSLLFRLYSYEGAIFIDGLETSTLRLSELRSSLGVIPQDPVLFSDSLRKNLDPFDEYNDEQIWRALEVVKLKQHVAQNLPTGLEHHINEGGRNFSVGQRQLVCLARAILKSPKVLVMDEATANVDPETDLLIQETIKSHFRGCTLVTIAHRLNTVLDYDKILVLDAGKIVEYDKVETLLAKEDGHFRRMLQSNEKQRDVS